MHHDHFLRASRPLRREADAQDLPRLPGRPIRVRLNPSTEGPMHKAVLDSLADRLCVSTLPRKGHAPGVQARLRRPVRVRLDPSSERPMHYSGQWLTMHVGRVRLDPSSKEPMHTERSRPLSLILVCASTLPRKGQCTLLMVVGISRPGVRLDPSAERPMHSCPSAPCVSALPRNGRCT
jgi:hypothetical protein